MEVLEGAIDCRPEETGYDSSRLVALNEHFQRIIEKKIIVGAQYTISHKGKIIANASIGGGSKISDEKMKPDMVFRIASITKTFTAVAIMQLVEAGYFRLDTKVGEILPQFSKPPFADISIWNMLTHTSGLYPDGGCYPDVAPINSWEYIGAFMERWDHKGEFDWITPGLLGGLRKPVGTQWMYNSFAFAVLGEVITKVSGKFAHDYIEENIIRKLSMRDTAFMPTKEMAERMYIRDEEDKEHIDTIIAGTFSQDEGNEWDKIPKTGGGIHSTTRDLIRFGNMMLGMGRLDGVRILGRKTVERMTTPQLHNIPDDCWGSKEMDRQYGIGFDMKRGVAFNYSSGSYLHEGSGACSLDMDPKEQLCAAWFVPWDNVEWSADALFNVQNIIWSGLM
ncbi:MAG: serine hydrolase [Lachnospiraceae bacterium]|nr:serine hydrolase [Lachnospiraceae bacterium]